jgi:hypothetical protein
MLMGILDKSTGCIKRYCDCHLKVKRMPSTEKETQKAILQYLEAKKIFHWRNNTGGTMLNNHFVSYGYKGSPDIICVIKNDSEGNIGRFLGIEVKDIKGKMNANQELFKENLERSGGIYLLARSIDDVTEFFETL